MYDALNRLTQKNYPDSTSAEYTYDLVGKVLQVNDPTGTYGFSYDNMGRLIGTSTQYSFLTGTFTNAYTYVTRTEDVKTALDKAVETFGRLDFAFNNAGIEPRKPAPTADYDLEEWERIIAIDLRGVFLCMKHEIPLMLKNGGGAIVNTSSGAGVIGIKGSPAYTAAKHGVIGLTRATALDYAAQNIRVNVVCPGYIDTPMMARFTGGTAEGRARVISEEPIGRMGRPEEIANAVVWLCSDAAGFFIGSAVVIDGGQTIQ